MLSKSLFFTSNTNNGLSQPSKDMEEFFEKRTKEHIERVKQNMMIMVGYQDFSLEALTERGTLHDQSKFSDTERTGYTWLSWWHHCKSKNVTFDYPDGIKAEVDKACQHHLKNNRHHVEAHESPEAMTKLDLLEMVCDWTAISQEYNQNGGSCKEYVVANIDKKWKFSANIKALIYEIIDELDKRIKLSVNANPAHQFKQ